MKYLQNNHRLLRRNDWILGALIRNKMNKIYHNVLINTINVSICAKQIQKQDT